MTDTETQALSYSERGRNHDVLMLLLSQSSRPWLIQSLQPNCVPDFLRLAGRLRQRAESLQDSGFTFADGIIKEVNMSPEDLMRDVEALCQVLSGIRGGRKADMLRMVLPQLAGPEPILGAWRRKSLQDGNEVAIEWCAR